MLTPAQTFYSAIAVGYTSRAAEAVGSADFSADLNRTLTPFGEALRYDDWAQGRLFLDRLEAGRQPGFPPENGAALRRQLAKQVEDCPWPQLLHLSDLLRQGESRPDIFRNSDPQVLQAIKEYLSAGDLTPSLEATSFWRAQRLILDVVEGGGNVVVMTGAGISAESGVPTYRGRHRMDEWRGLKFDQVANAEMQRKNPQLVWDFYQFRRGDLDGVEPNRAHYALAELEGALGDRFTLITQNVDGLHPNAGSRRIVELHGNLWNLTCTADCGYTRSLETYLPDLSPNCEQCGAFLRAGVTLFGENLLPDALGRALFAMEHADLLLVVGTKGLVEPASSMVVNARVRNIPIIQVNPSSTETTPLVRIFVQGKAGEVLPYLLRPTMEPEGAKPIDMLEASLTKAARYLELSNFERAIPLLRKVAAIAEAHEMSLNASPELAEMLLGYAEELKKRRDYSTAVDVYELAFYFSPNDQRRQRASLRIKIAACQVAEGERLKGEGLTFPVLSLIGALASRAISQLESAGSDSDYSAEEIENLQQRALGLRKFAVARLSRRGALDE